MNQPAQQQELPGQTGQLRPQPDHGEESYRGSGRLDGKAAVITGADSGIGRAVAIAFAREGADILISYLDEEEDDAQETRRWVEQAGRKAVLVPGDLSDPARCRTVIDTAVAEFGRVDILVSNAAEQHTHDKLEDITDAEWDRTLAVNLSALVRPGESGGRYVCELLVNLSAFFYLTKAALPHMRPGSSIIGTTSVNSDSPTPGLLPYDVTKAGIANMTAALAQLLAPRSIRANSVAPGPIWTPLIPSTMPSEQVESFGSSAPLGRPGQPAEVAPAYVLLASDEASYISGARIAITGGQPIL
jgi:NAD(P)-dependent dehydrogenase (short-subunit alcohol dehydrogenase family)